MELSQSLQDKGVRLNERGQIEFEVKARGYTAHKWRSCLESGYCRLPDSVREILTPSEDFDKKHRYKAGETLKVFLVRISDVEKSACCRASAFNRLWIK